VTCDLKPAQEQLADQVTHMQRVGRWVETDVQPDRPLAEASGQRGPVGGVVDQAT